MPTSVQIAGGAVKRVTGSNIIQLFESCLATIYVKGILSGYRTVCGLTVDGQFYDPHYHVAFQIDGTLVLTTRNRTATELEDAGIVLCGDVSLPLIASTSHFTYSVFSLTSEEDGPQVGINFEWAMACSDGISNCGTNFGGTDTSFSFPIGNINEPWGQYNHTFVDDNSPNDYSEVTLEVSIEPEDASC